MSAAPTPGDAAGAAKFVSTPGDYDGALSGTITLNHGGKTISAAF
jgi:hypothetical protein